MHHLIISYLSRDTINRPEKLEAYTINKKVSPWSSRGLLFKCAYLNVTMSHSLVVSPQVQSNPHKWLASSKI